MRSNLESPRTSFPDEGSPGDQLVAPSFNAAVTPSSFYSGEGQKNRN